MALVFTVVCVDYSIPEGHLLICQSFVRMNEIELCAVIVICNNL